MAFQRGAQGADETPRVFLCRYRGLIIGQWTFEFAGVESIDVSEDVAASTAYGRCERSGLEVNPWRRDVLRREKNDSRCGLVQVFAQNCGPVAALLELGRKHRAAIHDLRQEVGPSLGYGLAAIL